ncbi:MAG TPA: dienelactone hydrolase family protein [Polyangiaceae bacterium]|nr:dienelactone hydrolase family protein [Polyangiaceae bacterium]
MMKPQSTSGSSPRVASRRNVIKHTLSGGFALAVGPIASTALATPSDGLQAGEVKIPTNNGEIPAYRAGPQNLKRKAPVLLVVHEIFGVHEHIKDVCRRFAKLGYFAIAPELFARQGDPSTISDIKELQQKIVSKASDEQVMSDLDASVAWAKQQPHVDTHKLAITGFCWGGRITWLYAAHQPNLRAGVAWYGRLTGDRDPLHPKFPIDLCADLKAPVLGLYGGKDQGIPVETVEQMRTALQQTNVHAAKKSTIKVYPDSGHAFFADYRPSYNKVDAEDGFKRCVQWLKQHGVT